MIAMANPFAGYMTVREVMAAIEARAHTTVTRLAYDEEKPRPEGKRLAGTLIPGHGWMISRKSVAAFLAEEAAKKPGVGFPRGRQRPDPDAAPSVQPPAKAAKKPSQRAKAAKKPRK
jgi:hypothetical protein